MRAPSALKHRVENALSYAKYSSNNEAVETLELMGATSLRDAVRSAVIEWTADVELEFNNGEPFAHPQTALPSRSLRQINCASGRQPWQTGTLREPVEGVYTLLLIAEKARLDAAVWFVMTMSNTSAEGSALTAHVSNLHEASCMALHNWVTKLEVRFNSGEPFPAPTVCAGGDSIAGSGDRRLEVCITAALSADLEAWRSERGMSEEAAVRELLQRGLNVKCRRKR